MSHPVKLVVRDELRRSRLTVFFRLLLALPHLVWLVLWGIAAYLAALCNWVTALVAGTPWRRSHAFAARYVRYATHVYAYLYLIANPYPGFVGAAGYPVDVELPEPARQNRWITLFRLPLALPALLLAAALTSGFATSADWESSSDQGLGLLTAVAMLGWFAALALARMPRGLRDAGAYALSYATQLHAYLLVVTDRYPTATRSRRSTASPPTSTRSASRSATTCTARARRRSSACCWRSRTSSGCSCGASPPASR